MITNQPLGILVGLLPAVMLGFGALVCAVVAAARPQTRPSLYRWVTLLATAGAFTAALVELLAMRPSVSGVGLVAYSGGLMVDRFHVFGTVLVCLLVVLTVLGSEAYMRRVPARAGAFCALLQVSAGASVMLLAQREMSAFTVSFAVLVVSLTLLTAMTKTSGQTAEAALRQVIGGGLALATSVYGMTLLYAADGTTDLSKLMAGVRAHGAPIDGVLMVVGIALVVGGLVVVIGAPPLEAWMRDTQEAAPGAIAGFSSAIGVVTGTAVLARFAVEGFGAASPRWTVLVDVLAAGAMLFGGVLALRATTIRRLIADLSIAQSGFLLLAIAATGRGISGAPVAGPTALLFSLLAAAAALVAVLLLAGIFDAAGLGAGIDAYRGAGRRAPATAAFLCLGLLGLAGLPPLAGFFGRLLAAESALDAGGGWVVVIAVTALVLCGAAVVRWLAVIYGDDNGEAPFEVRTTPRVAQMAAWTAAGLGLLFAAFAGPLISIAGGSATALH
ncbi:MAG TPA: proton-conducting transporter membrane subunit [Candidatus Deferrimicrobium sp.]|nr:proton-conducting transporter membrane subunit [Candidatus Deferrimicrobium sp.]